MLGIDRLFEEEEGPVYGPQNRPTKDQAAQQHSGPPDPRPENGLCGIKNQGATCYLNALLQTLLYTPEFKEALFKLDSSQLGSLEDQGKPGSKVRVIPIQLQNLFSRLLLLDQASVNTSQLTDSFGWTGSEGFQQHDVQELSRILFSAIDASLIGTEGEQLVQRLYKGSIVNKVTCEECGRVSERMEDFFDLTAAVANYTSLEEYLTSCYLETERFEGRNKYRCEACSKLVNATKGAKLRSLPPILSVSLLRFSFDYDKMQRYKETSKYTFPFELDLRMYCDKEETEDTAVYELYSVVIHRGSCYGGHYHAYIKDVDGLGQWKTPVEEYTVIEPKNNSKKPSEDKMIFSSPMECLAMILAEQGGPGFSMAIDKLCQALIQTTGVSWNKQFKKQYGTVTKFLKKYNDLFMVDPCSNTVSLHKNESHDKQLHDTGSHGTNNDKQTIKEQQVKGQTAEQKLGVNNSTARELEGVLNTEPNMDEHQHWFDFNDSHVKPIHQKEIHKQFSGRESAYMLFYRRKSLPRPKEAYTNPAFGIPMDIIKEMAKLNSVLTTKRIEHDIELNTITLTVLHSQDYHYKQGSLHLKTDSNTCVTSLKIDRRKDVAQLIIATQEVLGDTFVEGSQLSIAKELPAGLHLYDMISEYASAGINHLGLVTGSKLFLWDGFKVSGQVIKTGEQSEPILLDITWIDGNGVKGQISHAFPKHSQFREVRLMISRLTEIQPEFLLISKLSSKKHIVMGASDDKLSLQELKFLDCDKICAEAKTRIGKAVFAEGELLGQEKLVRVKIENRCVANQEDDDWPLIEVETESDQTIEKLKLVILNKLGLTGDMKPDGGGRLRVCDATVGCQPPLFEQQSIGAAEIRHNSCLILEPGAPPKHNQITVSFSLGMPGNSSESNSRKEMIVNRTMTVGMCLRAILVTLDLKGDMYHLQKTNWLGEPADVLDDLDASLDQETVKDGEHVLVQAGKLPPRGFLSLPVWLYPPPNIPDTEAESSILNWITTIMKGLFNNSEDNEPLSEIEGTNIYLNNVEVLEDATVDMLKGLILKELSGLDISLPSTHYIRLRQVEHSMLTRVFRNNEQLLRRQKINSSTKLGVQILQEEENLKQNTIVLAIHRRNVKLRSYSKSEELIWDTTRSQTPESLKQALVDRVKIPLERIIIAKHQPEKFNWIIIPNSSQFQKNKGQKGKRKGGQNQRLNLKHAPYQLKDGDVIGVKDLQDDPEKKDDFSTEDDDLGKEKLRQIAEAKRKMRQESKKHNTDDVHFEKKKSKKEKRKEVALVIKVDDFK
ncbi:ubiquitin carboxyl-terminal hydrolase 40-like [Anneissia japonica]|uniref:ubiquitin carboxyl-terminal hydrolase 40-like n=1 Tax=Anneissia japonica TaxID=1529436 RepID=UPI0014254EFB|nr:ubiquitin carboxyl-terminal hydrolase 40-like [Anneissia japonica]